MKTSTHEIAVNLNDKPNTLKIVIRISDQTLDLYDGKKHLARYSVSTSKFGIGTMPNSFKTPTGRFRIDSKFGEDQPENTVFKGREPVVDSQEVDWENDPDLITSRILWLDGVEESNRNTKERYIYIHGTNQEIGIGTAASHGCIRMRNSEIIELFAQVPIGTAVEIF
jgi:lipoprotein-anchoring transpeptidase ErfK/SrfK